MKSTQKALQHILEFEELSEKGDFLNKISPFFKFIVLISFLIVNISIDKYDILKAFLMLSLSIYIVLISPITPWRMGKIICYLSFFILFVVIFNPIFDKNFFKIGNYNLNAGFISAIVIFVKFINTVSFTLSISSSIKINDLIYILNKIKLPKELIIVIMIMYRFLFIFLKDIISTLESIKSRKTEKLNYKDMKNIVSNFIVMGIYRSESVYEAIKSRGTLYIPKTSSIDIKNRDILFLSFSLLYIFGVRFFI